MGFQTIASGSRVREHSHGDQVEVQICFRGRGRVVVDGVTHDLVPGTACFLGEDVTHEIINESREELVMLWVITPPGLESFFEAIGRQRTRGEPAPVPFARPGDVVAIERAMGMNAMIPRCPTTPHHEWLRNRQCLTCVSPILAPLAP
jgi:hypothetical protein